MNVLLVLSNMPAIITLVVVLAVILLVLLFVLSYVKAAPDTAIIVSGMG